MNHTDSNSDLDPDRSRPLQDLDLSMEDLCLAYLLGDLDDDLRRSFEQSLAHDAKVAETLLEQSEVIVGLAHPTPLSATPSRSTNAPRARTSSLVPWVSIAVAACLGWFVLGLVPQSETERRLVESNADASDDDLSSNLETILIATAWADQVAEESFVALDETEDSLASDLDSWPETKELMEDETEWMFVGLSSDDTAATGDQNDDQG